MTTVRVRTSRFKLNADRLRDSDGNLDCGWVIVVDLGYVEKLKPFFNETYKQKRGKRSKRFLSPFLTSTALD
jgi:hypothetical protein